MRAFYSDGTASIFHHDPAIFTLSLHGAHNFPFQKEASDLDVAFADGAGDDEYLAALRAAVPRVLDEQRPDVVFYPRRGRPLCRRSARPSRSQHRGTARARPLHLQACRSRGLPIAVAMSGGYAVDINAIVTIHTNTIRAALRSLCP